jgi:hypothetical protein
MIFLHPSFKRIIKQNFLLVKGFVATGTVVQVAAEPFFIGADHVE